MNAEWWQLLILDILFVSLLGAFGSGGGFRQSGKNGSGAVLVVVKNFV